MYRDKKKITIIAMLVAIVVMAVGYAAFSTSLNISGTANIESNWSVFISNVVVSETSGTATNMTGSPTFENLRATMNADFKVPGDWITYEVTITNDGSFDAVIDEITTNETGSTAIIHSISGIEIDETIPQGTTKSFIVKIEYDPTITTQPTVLEKTLTLSINCVQDIEENSGGSGSTTTLLFNKESQSDLTVTSQEDISTFEEVQVDGETVDSSNYTVTSGSTIVTFKKEYLNTLSAGTHTIDIISTSGTHSTPFEVATTKPSTSLVENILKNNEVYADNVPSKYVTGAQGIDFSQTSPPITLYSEVQGTTSSSLYMESSSVYYYGTSYSFDITTGIYSLIGTTSGKWSAMSRGYSRYPYTCKSTSAIGTCTTLYKMTGYTSATYGTAYTYTSTISENTLSNNGKGLYYTSTNTKNNLPTYYFRGDVENNYVKFGKIQEGACIYNGYSLGLYMSSDEVTEEMCNSESYCVITGELGTSKYYLEKCDLQSPGFEVVDGERSFFNVYDIVWRIVRINEDGSVRLITEDSIGSSLFSSNINDNAYVGYMYGTIGATGDNAYKLTHTNTTDSTIKDYLDNWYTNNTNLSTYKDSHLADAGFCNDRSVASSAGLWNSSDTALGYAKNQTYYGAYNRLVVNKTPQFACPNPTNDLFTTSTSTKGNKALTNPIGLLTADEIAYAGGVYDVPNENMYLTNGGYYWTMSPFRFDGSYANEWRVNLDGNVSHGVVSNDFRGVRPVVNLQSGVEITGGDGTSGNPYIIK